MGVIGTSINKQITRHDPIVLFMLKAIQFAKNGKITTDGVAKMVRVGYTELFMGRFKEHFRRKLLKSYSGLTDISLF